MRPVPNTVQIPKSETGNVRRKLDEIDRLVDEILRLRDRMKDIKTEFDGIFAHWRLPFPRMR